MSRLNTHSFTALGAVAATATQTSISTSVVGVSKLSYHCKFSAANSGAFTVEAQNSDADTWVSVPFNVTMTLTAETEALIVMNEVPFKNLRLVWTPSAGSGTLTAVLSMKVGA